MKHYKEFLIKLQTLNIQITQKKLVSDGVQREFSIYSISHENPHLSAKFKNELKELRELALVDILNLSGEQIELQLQRLGELKERFHKFWDNLNNSHVPIRSEDSTELLYSLRLSDILIVTDLSFQDHARAGDDLINDLQDSIRARQKVLREFEEGVLKIIRKDKASEKAINSKPGKKEEQTPVFKDGVAGELYELVKDYFKPVDQPDLKDLLANGTNVDHPLTFYGNGNQLADAFKQLFEANLVVGCNKIQLINWLMEHFAYIDKGVAKNYSEKYLLDIISSNTKTCQSPILNVHKKEGQFMILPLQRNNRR